MKGDKTSGKSAVARYGTARHSCETSGEVCHDYHSEYPVVEYFGEILTSEAEPTCVCEEHDCSYFNISRRRR